MKEIQRIAGSEQDFNQMNVLQRRAFAKTLGQSVEGLARIVRNQGPGATGAAAGAAMTDPGSDKVAVAIGQTGDETNRLLGKLVRNTE
jgi:hypothetical protein